MTETNTDSRAPATEAAYTFSCQWCGVAAGKRCLSNSGKMVQYEKPHNPRWLAGLAKVQREKGS